MLAADPHDDLMLTDRPTTVVHQATAVHDRMPDFYGASEDEENLFASTGARCDGYLGAFDSLKAMADRTRQAVEAAGGSGAVIGAAMTEASALAAINAGGPSARAIYDWALAQPVDARKSWLAARPQTAKALDAYARENSLPLPLPPSKLPMLFVGVAVAGLLFYLMKAKR